jgi:hypothetical protein
MPLANALHQCFVAVRVHGSNLADVGRGRLTLHAGEEMGSDTIKFIL